MPKFIPWSSQPFDSWASQYAQGKFIDLDGHRTHYFEKGEGQPLILLHGFFYDSYLWNANIDVLAQHFKVYAIDLWGCGYSTREQLDYGYPIYARQVLLFMDSLGIKRASIVGQSMGAGTAILFAVQHPERVNKLILVDAAGMPNPLPFLARFFNLPIVGEFFLSLKTNAIRKKALEDAFIHNKELITEDYFENVTRAHKIKHSTRVGLKIQRKEFFDKLSTEIQQLAEKQIPTLIVWGREDRAIPIERGKAMHRILDGSRLEVIDNAGHVPNFEFPERFNNLAVDFLKETSAQDHYSMAGSAVTV